MARWRCALVTWSPILGRLVIQWTRTSQRTGWWHCESLFGFLRLIIVSVMATRYRGRQNEHIASTRGNNPKPPAFLRGGRTGYPPGNNFPDFGRRSLEAYFENTQGKHDFPCGVATLAP